MARPKTQKFVAIRFHEETADRFSTWCREMRYDYSKCLEELMDLAGIPSYEKLMQWLEDVRKQNPFSDKLSTSVKREKQ